MFVCILYNHWIRVNNSVMETWPQLQMDFSLKVLGSRKKHISCWFSFSSKMLFWFFHISFPHLFSLTVLITSISTHYSSVIFSEGLFWFHTRTIVIKIFSPDFWLYILVIKYIHMTNVMHKIFFCQNKLYYFFVSSANRIFM